MSDNAGQNSFRRLGYRLLPADGFSYILHMRPAEWPIMAAHTLVGYLIAVGVDGAIWGDSRGAVVTALIIWVIFLNGGTLAINSVFDRDDGDIGYLKAPPKPPKYLLEFSLVLLVGGLVWSFTLPFGFRVAYGISFVMSILYSVPPFRFKAVAGVDWVINMVGFGTLTPYAAYAATGKALDSMSALALLGFCPLFAALYPLTQLYQFEEDSRRGDRTLALILGMKRSLMVALGAVAVAFGFFGAAWMVRGGHGYAWDPGFFGLGAIVLAGVLWVALLARWLENHQEMTPDQHQAGMYRALAIWAITDVAVLFAFAV